VKRQNIELQSRDKKFHNRGVFFCWFVRTRWNKGN